MLTTSDDTAVRVPVSRRPSIASQPFPAARTADLAARVRETVTALRAAIVDGTVHEHRSSAVVRAWSAGEDLDAQRRVCRVCTG